jgi:hypothetical protein
MVFIGTERRIPIALDKIQFKAGWVRMWRVPRPSLSKGAVLDFALF